MLFLGEGSHKITSGLKYSVAEDYFIFAENLPKEWSFMEFEVPVVKSDGEEQWVSCRVERERLASERSLVTVTVENNPFSQLVIRPWLEEAQLESLSPDNWLEESPPPGHLGWVFQADSAQVAVTLRQ